MINTTLLGKDAAGRRGGRPSLWLSPRAAEREDAESWMVRMVPGLASSGWVAGINVLPMSHGSFRAARQKLESAGGDIAAQCPYHLTEAEYNRHSGDDGKASKSWKIQVNPTRKLGFK